VSDLGGICAVSTKLLFILPINCRLAITPIHNGTKPEDITDGKEIPNVDDVVTKVGGHDEFMMRDRIRGLGERRGANEHKVDYVSIGDQLVIFHVSLNAQRAFVAMSQ
jgi:hypothetical protein